MPQTNMKAKSLNRIGSFSIFLEFNLVSCAFKFSDIAFLWLHIPYTYS